MASHTEAQSTGESGGGVPKASFPLIPLLNSVALLATAGYFYYSKILYKRPVITEASERRRLKEKAAVPSAPTTPASIVFEPITVNVKPEPLPLNGDSTQQIQGKLHYATVGFTLEIRDKNQQNLIEGMRAFILDKFIQTLGKKPFNELTTVQGRYILQSEMIDFINHFVIVHSLNPSKDPLVTRIFFTQFIVQ